MPLIPEEQLEQIRDQIDIIELVSERVPLRKAGQNFKGLCPFHTEKTPSFTVNPDKQIFHCFGCGEGGNAFRFLMNFEGISFVEAVQQLADRTGIRLKFVKGQENAAKNLRHRKSLAKINRYAAEYYFNQLHQEASGAQAQAYLSERGIAATTAQRYLVGYAPSSGRALAQFLTAKKVPMELAQEAGLVRKGARGDFFDFFRDRLIFPIRNAAGEFIGFGGRIFGEATTNQPKYLNTPESPLYHKGREVYGLYEARTALRESQQALLVEGYMDVIGLAQAGLGSGVAPLGTAVTADQIKRIHRNAKELFVIFDGDRAGQKAAWRALEIVLDLGVPARMLALPATEDPDSFIRAHGLKAFQQQLLAAPGLMDYFIDKIVALSSPDNVGKTEAVKQLMPQLARVSGEVEKALYIQRLAAKLALPEQVVWRELQSNGQRTRNFRSEGADDIDAKRHRYVRLSPFERDLLRAILSNGEGASDLSAELEPQDWKQPELRQMWTQIQEALALGTPTSKLIELFQMGPLRQELTALLIAGEEVSAQQVNELIVSCRQQLKRQQLEQKRQELTRRIQEAEAKLDKESLETLLLEKNNLLKELDQNGYR